MAATNEYLTAQVMTATPQKLHLMLIDGAIRFAQQAKQVWEDEARRQLRDEALTRCVKISGEMLASMRGSNLPGKTQLTAVYAWLFRTFTEAKILSSREKVDEALELLAVERETWRQVCEKFGAQMEEGSKGSSRLPATSESARTFSQEVPLGGLSLEA
jgi:flagellar protein FliS